MSRILHPADSWSFYWPAEENTLIQAIAGKHNLLDLARLDNASPDFAYKFILQLLGSAPDALTFNPGFEAGRTLTDLYFSERNREKSTGRRLLGVGYPLVAFFQDNEMITAPLYIWDATLEPEVKGSNEWTLTPDAGQKPACNPWLINWLRTGGKQELAEWYTGSPDRQGWNAAALFAVCNEFCLGAALENPSQSIASTAQPNLVQLDELASKGTMIWSALLGSFKRAEFSRPAERPEAGHKSPQAQTPPFSLIDMDPWQAAVLNFGKASPLSVAEGNAGSGKTHLLLSFLIDSLAREERCLVVSPWTPVLTAVKNRLGQLGFGELSFVLRHPYQDLAAWSGAFRLAGKKTAGDAAKVNDQQISLRFEQVSREKNRLDRQYRARSKKVFGDKNWTETVGLFLASNRIEGKELLGNQLNTQDFSFSPDNFDTLRDAVARCAIAFDKIKTLDHPLNNLNAGIFVHQSKQESLQFIQDHIESFLQKASQFQYRYIHTQNEYGERLRSYFDHFYFEVHDQITRLSERVKDTVTLYGKDVLKSSKPTLKLYGIFAEKYKAALNAREEIAVQYQSLKKSFLDKQLFDHNFADEKEARSLPVLRDNLEKLSDGLEEWRNRISPTVQEDLTRLSAKTAHPGLGFASQIESLEDGLDSLIDEINGSGLYQLPFQNNMLTLPKRQKLLEDIIHQLEATQLNLRDYGAFYDWQRLWFSLPEHARKIIRSIVKVKPNDWVAAFDSWFLHQCLESAYDPALPIKAYNLEPFASDLDAVRDLLRKKTVAQWNNLRAESIKRFRKDKKALFENFVERSDLSLSAGQITGKAFQEVTDCFPILMATPGAAADLLAHQSGVWDRVIFLYPEFLPGEPGLIGLGRSALGIGGQFPEIHPRSMSALLLENGASTFPLEQIHRYFPGNLFNPHPSGAETGQILFEQVDGRYDEGAETNEEEARKVLDWLNKIEPTKQRTLPSVGIACMTTGQRNLIQEYLLRIKQKRLPGVEKIQQLERNGLAIFRADETSGQQFDVLLISCTFGHSNIGGALTRHILRFNQPGSQTALIQLMSAGTQELRVANSIPGDNLDQMMQAPAQKGVFLLGSWVRYLKARSENDETAVQRVIRATGAVYGGEETANNPLAEEIAWHIAGRMRTDRIQMNVPFGELKLPLVILPEEPKYPSLVIQPDHFFAQAQSTDFIWENRQRQDLEKAGYRIIPAWSVQWWKNPRRESAELLKAIQEAPPAVEEEE